MVTYPAAAVLPLAVLAALVTVGAVALTRSRRLATVGGTLAAAGAVVVATGAGLSAVIGLWRLVVVLVPRYADTGPFLGRALPFQVAAVALAGAVTLVWFLLLRRRPGPFAAAGGVCVVLAVLGVVAAVALPGMSFLFAVPALGLGAGLAVAAALRDRAVTTTAVAAVPAVALLVPFGWASFALGGLSTGLPGLVAVLTFAAAGALLLPASGGRPVATAAVALVLVTAVAAGVAIGVDRPTAANPQATSLAFLQDADAGTAVWASADSSPDAWTRRFVGSEPVDLPAWTGTGPDQVTTGPAAPLPVPGPSVTVLERSAERVVLQVSSPRGAPTVLLRTDRPLASSTAVYPGRPAATAAPDGPRVRLSAVGPGGVRVTLVPAAPGPLGLAVSDVSDGLVPVPGFVPRPPERRAAADRTSDQIVVTRRVCRPDRDHRAGRRVWPLVADPGRADSRRSDGNGAPVPADGYLRPGHTGGIGTTCLPSALPAWTPPPSTFSSRTACRRSTTPVRPSASTS